MRLVIIVLAVGLVLAASLRKAQGFNFDGSMPGDHAVPAVQPDPRVRWTPYPAGGLLLCSPDTCIVLPPGTVLVVPTALTDSLQMNETT